MCGPRGTYASSLTGSQYPPMGQRFRLKASFVIDNSFSPHAQVILRALKKYGMILADNGSAWYISGAPDERWNNDVLHELDVVVGSDFEAVDVSSLMVNPDSGQVLTDFTLDSSPCGPRDRSRRLDELSTYDSRSWLLDRAGDGHSEFAVAECDDRVEWIDRECAGIDYADRHRHASARLAGDLVLDPHHGHGQRRHACGERGLVGGRDARVFAGNCEILSRLDARIDVQYGRWPPDSFVSAFPCCTGMQFLCKVS